MQQPLGKVYKRRYISCLENSFLFNMGALAIGTSYTGGEGKSHAAVVHTLVGITVLQCMEISSSMDIFLSNSQEYGNIAGKI